MSPCICVAGANDAHRRVASQSGVTNSGASHAAGSRATMGSVRQGIWRTSGTGGCGLATMPISSEPALSRCIDSAEPTASSRISTPGLRWARASSMRGSSWVLTPADTPTRTTPSRPQARRRTRSTRSSAACSNWRPSCTSTSPAGVNSAWRRPRTTSSASSRDSSSLMCRLTVGGARCSAWAAAAKVPRSAMAIRVCSWSRFRLRMGVTSVFVN